jgi:poly(3-hydroxybutyrate) depolymerase
LFVSAVGLAGSACVAEVADPETASALAAVTCSAYLCEPTLTTAKGGAYRMFDETSFPPIVDGWGTSRQFYVHIPARYDSLASDEQMPVIFAFHGGGLDYDSMVDDQWADYFEQDYAFVIPRGEPDPCDAAGGKRQWLAPGIAERSTPSGTNCDPSTAVTVTRPGQPSQPGTYWTTSMPESFTDVEFATDLRAAVLGRFPKLNPNKVYATGFSAGGGLSFALACYRSSLFRGFSVVAKSLDTFSVRGDYGNTGVIDPLSMRATCGHNELDLLYATGLASPQLWGSGQIRILLSDGSSSVPPLTLILPKTVTKPVVWFVGDNDPNMSGTEIDSTHAFLRERNNLGTGYTFQNNYNNIGSDNATTQRRTYTTAANAAFPSSALRRFRVSAPGLASQAAHAPPDTDHCPPNGPIMTCDYDYTAETIAFLQNQAELSLVP